MKKTAAEHRQAIADADQQAADAARRSGGCETEETWARNRQLAEAQDAAPWWIRITS